MWNSFDDYVVSRCLEILENDSEYEEANNIITCFENELRKTLTIEQLNILNKIDNEKDNLICSCTTKIYKAGFNDRIKEF